GGLSKQEQLAVEGNYRLLNEERLRALEIYKTLFDYYPDNPDYGLLLAEVYKSIGRAQEAQAVVAALHRMPGPARNDLRIDGWEDRVAMGVKDYDGALAIAQRMRGEAQASGSRVFVADARYIEALALQMRCDYEAAIDAANDAQGLFAALGDFDGVARQMS